jgi:hypothetical protein
MPYKTIILNLLQQRPQMHEQLRKARRLLVILERYAQELKASHEGWMTCLAWANPGSDLSQNASQALELALRELEASLPTELPPDEDETASLDAAMAFLSRTPSA